MLLLDKLTVQKKVQLIVPLFVLICLICYRFTIQKTVDLYQTFRQNELLLQQAQSAPQFINQYTAQISQHEQSFNVVDYNRSRLFEVCNTFCKKNSLFISSFPPEHRKIIENGYELVTNEIAVSGNYADILKLIYDLEYVKNIGHIASTHFEKKYDRHEKKTSLIATIFIRNILHSNTSHNENN